MTDAEARRRAPRWLRALGRRLRGAPSVQTLATELGYRFKRRTVDRRLEQTRGLPRALHLEATNVCNARCVFCAYPQMERPKQTMPMARFESVVDQYVALGGSHVSLTPIVGDPFVDPHLFERLDHLAQRPEIQGFYFFTNAIRMTRRHSRRLVGYGERLRVCVSMGGFDRQTWARLMGVDRFDQAWRNLQDFVAEADAADAPASLEIHLRCADSDLRGEAWEQVRAWQRQGRVTVAAIDHYDSWAGKIPSAELAAHGLEPAAMPHKRGACELLYMKPVVLADGRVNACACRDVEAELVVGDLEHDSLEQVLDGPTLADLRQRHRRGDFPDVCRRCTYYVSVYNPLASRIDSDELSWNPPGNESS